jgi:hypothetical protein
MRTDRSVRVTRDPTNVSHTGEPVIRMDVKDILDGHGRREKVSSSGMDNSLGFSGGSRRLQGDASIKDKKQKPSIGVRTYI